MDANTAAPVAAGYATAATSKGQLDSSVSRQWATRPADQRFTSLDALATKVQSWRDCSATHAVNPTEMIVRPQEDGNLLLEAPGLGELLEPTNWSFGQVCQRVGAPADYVAKLPAKLAAANLQYGLKTASEEASAYVRNDGVLRAMTSQKYGRIYDADVVAKVQALVQADPRWKIPGMIDWSTAAGGKVVHNPYVDVTTQNTTLYASDRDVWLFLCQDANPIEIGTLPDGSPDLLFRGFIVSNSEVGAQTFYLKTMLLRGVCQNRNLWGVQDVTEVSIRHTAGAPERWESEAVPALEAYANASALAVVERVKAARAITVASTEGEALDFLMSRKGGNFSKTMANKIMARVKEEEGHPLHSLWDAVQGITAQARRVEFQDRRVALEEIAGRIMERVSA